MAEKKKLGILGGMGSEATEVFFKRIIDRTKVENDREHLDMFIYNHASLPDRTAYILEGRQRELWDILEQDVRLLDGVGCDYVAVPCNTCHYFGDNIRGIIGDKFLDMLRETARYISSQNKKRIGIMATEGTVKSGLYEKALSEYGIELLYPDRAMQDKVMSIIYDQIKKGDKGSLTDFQYVVDNLRGQGAEAVLLACTELSVFRENYQLTDTFFIDALDVLARACIVSCGGVLRNM